MISLRLPKTLGSIVKASGKVIVIDRPPDVSITVTGFHVIQWESFMELIKQEGFGTMLWNDYGAEGFVTIEVQDKGLTADILQVGVPLDKLSSQAPNSSFVAIDN
jgi:hypothetical protein